ncbi:MAG: YdcF family protein [Bacteroidia bacterium]
MRFLDVGLLVGVLLYLFRYSLAQAGVWYLAHVPTRLPMHQVEGWVVLSGAPWERGILGASLYEKHPRKIVCVGGNFPQDRLACGNLQKEGALIAAVIREHCVPAESVLVVSTGTSTLEEIRAVISIAKAQGWKKVGIISSLYHKRRLYAVCRKVLEPQGIEFQIYGTPPMYVYLPAWWRQEQGLIMIVNEYTKIIYHALRYGILELSPSAS